MNDVPNIPPPYQEGFWESVRSQLTQPIFSYVAAGIFIALVMLVVLAKIVKANRKPGHKKSKSKAFIAKNWLDSRAATVVLLILAAFGLVFVYSGEAARKNNQNPCQGRPFAITLDDPDPVNVTARSGQEAISKRIRELRLPTRISRNFITVRASSTERVARSKQGNRLDVEMISERVNGKWAVTEVTKCL